MARSDHSFFFFNDTATTEIYTLSLHDALPISTAARAVKVPGVAPSVHCTRASPSASVLVDAAESVDRKSTRLNSSHANISYAVFCLKKKKKTTKEMEPR